MDDFADKKIDAPFVFFVFFLSLFFLSFLSVLAFFLPLRAWSISLPSVAPGRLDQPGYDDRRQNRKTDAEQHRDIIQRPKGSFAISDSRLEDCKPSVFF